MGLTISNLLSGLYEKKNVRILMGEYILAYGSWAKKSWK